MPGLSYFPSGGGVKFKDEYQLEATYMENLDKGQLVFIKQRTFHDDPVTAIDPTLSTTGSSCSFSFDGNSLAITEKGASLLLTFTRDGATYIKDELVSILPSGTPTGCSLSGDGSILVVSHSMSPYITVYKKITGRFLKIPNPSIPPSDSGRGCAISKGGNLIVISHKSYPYVTLYDFSNKETLVKLPTPAISPSGPGQGCAVSSDGSSVCVTHLNSPFVTVYDVSGADTTKLPAFFQKTTGTPPPTSCKFSNNGHDLLLVYEGV